MFHVDVLPFRYVNLEPIGQLLDMVRSLALMYFTLVFMRRSRADQTCGATRRLHGDDSIRTQEIRLISETCRIVFRFFCPIRPTLMTPKLLN